MYIFFFNVVLQLVSCWKLARLSNLLRHKMWFFTINFLLQVLWLGWSVKQQHPLLLLPHLPPAQAGSHSQSPCWLYLFCVNLESPLYVPLPTPAAIYWRTATPSTSSALNCTIFLTVDRANKILKFSKKAAHLLSLNWLIQGLQYTSVCSFYCKHVFEILELD